MLALAADMFTNPTAFLPESERPKYPAVPWFPTLTMTLELKFPIPKGSKTFGPLCEIVDLSMTHRVDMMCM
ncbi:hypothetical protein Moror_4023 [Moniliophthora roreri MCA 2997]|uniref:Uncharacterized protein n=1 Tax=Moniliophthora roreri (strain MCA 2997) TaxID=1381753 RepID=V2XRV4_MONRO|nr:hypothetical protein Moror_4023 [Moniliophthora roreri MCA 2997]